MSLEPEAGGETRRAQSSAGTYRFAAVPERRYALTIKGDDGPRASRQLLVDEAGWTYTTHLVTLY